MKKFINPLGILLFVIFIDVIGIGILFPIIPQLLANPQSPSYILGSGLSLESGYIILGLLSAVYPLGQFISTPILGQLSDKYGRKSILAICLSGTAISYAVFAIAIISHNLPLLFVSRLADGITGGNISVAQAAIADLTDPAERSKNFGLMGAVSGIGFIIGPVIGAKLADSSIAPWFNTSTPFWFASALTAINVLMLISYLPETNKNILRSTKVKFSQALTNISLAITNRRLFPIYLTNFLATVGFAFFTTFASVYLFEKFGFKESETGNYFAFFGFTGALAQILVVGPVIKRFNEVQVLKGSILLSGILVTFFAMPIGVAALLVLTAVFNVFNGLSMATLPGLLSRSAADDEQGELLGIGASVQAIGEALPTVFAGIVAASFSSSATIVVAGLIVILAGLLFIFMYRKYNAPEVQTINSED